MDFYRCEVRLGGDVGFTVPREMVSASEIVMIRKIHGPDSVINIEYEATRKNVDEDVYTEMETKFCLNKANEPIFRATFGEPESPRMIASLSVKTQERIAKDVDESIPSEDKTLAQAKEECRRLGGKINKDDTLEDVNARIAELKALS